MGQEKLSLAKRNENGYVLFSGIVRLKNGRGEEKICELLAPPLPVKRNNYICDKRFHTEIIKDLYSKKEMYGYLIIANDKTILANVEGTRNKILKKIQGDLATETRRGGQSANRIARIRQEKREEYKKKIVESCILFNGCQGVIIGGCAEIPKEVHKMLESDSRLHFKILGRVKISSGNPIQAFEETRNKSEEIISGKEFFEEQKEIKKVQNLLETNPDLLVFGKDNIWKYDKDFFVDYVLTSEKVEMNCKTVLIHHSKFLEDYDGMIGILYFQNPYGE